MAGEKFVEAWVAFCHGQVRNLSGMDRQGLTMSEQVCQHPATSSTDQDGGHHEDHLIIPQIDKIQDELGPLGSRAARSSKGDRMSKEPPPRANLRALSSCMTGGLSGFTRWHYMSELPVNTVAATPDFFLEANKMIRRGDMIDVSARDGFATLGVAYVSEEKVITAQMCGVFVLPDGRRKGE